MKFVINATARTHVDKTWGYEDWIWNGRYCGKKLFINQGKECSFHCHKVKDEVMYLERGKVLLTYGWDDDISHASTLTLTPDMAFHIPPGMFHRFHGIEESVLIEFSTHHSDKDVVRAADPRKEAINDESDSDEHS